MKGRAAALLAALVVAALIILWYARDALTSEPDPVVPEPDDPLPEDLTSLPNYRKAGDHVTRFATHTDFVRALSDAFLDRVPARGARGLLIAHAATAGWHLPDRAPCYWNNFWGQLTTDERIRAGELFTILKAPGGKYHPYRAFTSIGMALEGYLENVRAYGTGGVSYLDTRQTTLIDAECRQYAELIKPWFAIAQRTSSALDEKARDWHWIWRNKIEPVIG